MASDLDSHAATGAATLQIGFRRFFAATARGLIATICGLLVVEASLRLYDGVPLLDITNFVAAKADLANANIHSQYDEVLGWVTKPNQQWVANNARLYSGKFGIRLNHDNIVEPSSGGIIVSGDSFAAGAEVGNSETWPAYLERALAQPVINGAVGGYALDQIELRAEALTPILNPRTIILSFESGALLNNEYRVWAGGGKPYFTIDGGELVLHNQPVRRLANKPEGLGIWRSTFGYSHLANTLITGAGYGKEWWDSNVYIKTGADPIEVACLLLKRMQRFAADRDIRYLALLQYNGASITAYAEEPPFAAQVVRCARDAEIELVDTWQPLKTVLNVDGLEALKRLHVMHDGGRVYGHLSAAGNELVAGLLAKRLQPGGAKEP